MPSSGCFKGNAVVMDQVKDEVLLERIARTYSDNEQITAIVEHLIASCDYYVARYVQESALLEDQSKQLTEVKHLLNLAHMDSESACTETNEAQGLMSRQGNAQMQQIKLDKLANDIFQLISYGDELAKALERKEKQCARQKVQIDYLNARVERYQRLVARIKQTWYGKFLIKIYHAIRKHF